MVIMPTGKSYHNWSLDTEGKTVKVASGKQVASGKSNDRDSLYEAAEKYLAGAKKQQKKAQFDFGKKDECCKCEEGKEEFGDKEVAEVAVEGNDEVASVKEVIEEVEIALDDAKAKLDGVSGEGADEEVVVELPEGDDSEVQEVEFEIGGDEFADKKDEVPGVDTEKEEEKEEGEKGIAKKSEDTEEVKEEKADKKGGFPFNKGKEEKEDSEESEEGEEKTAGTVGGFQRLADISPTTRKKIYTYWTEYLGYPKDYCKLLVTDFEKK